MWYSAVGFIVPLLLSLLAVPLAAAAQPPGQVYRIGFLSTNPPPARVWDALLEGLRERGYIEGRNLVLGDSLLYMSEQPIAEFATQHHLPSMWSRRDSVMAGGLMSYGSSLPDRFRRAAYYVDRILKGAKPADLPVEQPTKFELVINLKTAQTLGLTIPPSVLFQADEVIK
jgi:putative ABC transport system substrate-binding protein